MGKQKPLTMQFIIIGGFMVFMYIFFALTTSIYRDYKLELNIKKFKEEIDELAHLAKKKPEDVKYFESVEFKDRYAKENLNLINPGERVIIMPQGDQIIKPEAAPNKRTPDYVIQLPVRLQWWEYFFGQTLSVGANQKKIAPEAIPINEPAEETPLDKPVL